MDLKVASVLAVTALLALVGVHCQIKGVPVKFKLTAINLPPKDVGGTNDPYVEAFVRDATHGYDKFGETPYELRTNDPVWTNVFHFNYIKGTNQTIKFVVRDWDLGWNRDDHLGRIEVDADDIVRQMAINSKSGHQGEKAIKLFLTRPKGGVLVLHPILNDNKYYE